MNGLNRVFNVLKQLAPTIAAALGTPLLGSALTALEGVLGLAPDTNLSVDDRATAVALAINVASPEVLAAIRKADQEYAAKMAELGFKDKEMLAQLEYQTKNLEIESVTDARRYRNIHMLALWVLMTFAFVMTGVLYGCYLLLTGGIPIKDVAVVAAVSGLVGSVVGYVAANAQTVVNSLYSASLGQK